MTAHAKRAMLNALAMQPLRHATADGAACPLCGTPVLEGDAYRNKGKAKVHEICRWRACQEAAKHGR